MYPSLVHLVNRLSQLRVLGSGPKGPRHDSPLHARLRALAFLQMFNSACLDSSLSCPDTHSVISELCTKYFLRAIVWSTGF